MISSQHRLWNFVDAAAILAREFFASKKWRIFNFKFFALEKNHLKKWRGNFIIKL